jgi:hypothetical protein
MHYTTLYDHPGSWIWPMHQPYKQMYCVQAGCGACAQSLLCYAYVLPQNCRNVLVRSNPVAPGGATAKLADFGLSRAMKQHQTHRTTKTCGTLSHMVRRVQFTGPSYALFRLQQWFCQSDSSL